MFPDSLRMFIFRLSVSPAMPGIFFLLLGMLVTRFPPKSLNHFYGYRTPRSMRSQDAWAEANQYAPALMIRLGTGSIIFGVGCSVLVPYRAIALVMGGATLTTVVILLVSTERRLNKLFDREGKRRS